MKSLSLCCVAFRNSEFGVSNMRTCEACLDTDYGSYGRLSDAQIFVDWLFGSIQPRQ